MVEILVPMLPESVTDALVAKVYKQVGDYCGLGDALADLETDKVMLEVPATVAGIVEQCLIKEGDSVQADQIIMHITPAEKPQQADKPVASEAVTPKASEEAYSPSVRKALFETGADPKDLNPSGPKKRLMKEDVTAIHVPKRHEERVPMSRLRATIAERLVMAQQEAAMLTTFNDVNMQPIMDIRSAHKEVFEKKHGVKLGFMSFFVLAAVRALQSFPAVNASIDGKDIVYHHYQDVGIAVSSDRGLVVPVLRSCESLSMAEIEMAILDYAKRASQGKLSLQDMQGGTFTISNGGVFGSMLSTPIINPPQSAILGMHRIEKRPVVENDQVVIRPMMYLALSYDHRIIDGKESVQFLGAIKKYLEDPARLLLAL